MTTSQSPIAALRGQAAEIARTMKAVERGDLADPTGKIAAARAGKFFKTGIVMDDKVVTIEMTWATIRANSEAAIAEFVYEQMRGAGNAAN